MNNVELGNEGEEIASDYLKKNNHKILKRNFRCKLGEIDIISIDRNTGELVITEVKTRTNKKFGEAREAIDKQKQKHIASATKYFVFQNCLFNTPLRFDAIEVYIINEDILINHIRNCDIKQ